MTDDAEREATKPTIVVERPQQPGSEEKPTDDLLHLTTEKWWGHCGSQAVAARAAKDREPRPRISSAPGPPSATSTSVCRNSTS